VKSGPVTYRLVIAMASARSPGVKASGTDVHCPLLTCRLIEPVQVMSVGAVYDRAFFLESMKYARS